MMDQETFAYGKAIGVFMSACGIISSAGLFAIRSLIRQNNDRLMDKFNGRYLKRELYEAHTAALNVKLDLIHDFQHQRHEIDRDRFDEVSDLCQAVKAITESQNVRLAVIESKIEGKGRDR